MVSVLDVPQRLRRIAEPRRDGMVAGEPAKHEGRPAAPIGTTILALA